MSINILCLGDIIGRPGRQVIMELLPDFIKSRNVDLVVANAENSAGGSGLTPSIFDKLLAAGVNVCTMGDHTYRRREVIKLLETSNQLIRPGNFPRESIGKGWTLAKTAGGASVAILQVMGRVYMDPIDSPYPVIDRMLDEVPRDVLVRVVDFHAEASSEKVGMGWYLDGRVSICFGTHTHTPTADARVLPGGTAFISDVGMTGPYASVLGRRTERVLKFFTTGMPQMFDVATGDPRMSGILATIDEKTGKALSIQRVEVHGTEQTVAYDADDNRPGYRKAEY